MHKINETNGETSVPLPWAHSFGPYGQLQGAKGNYSDRKLLAEVSRGQRSMKSPKTLL